jgi:LysR family transcriptional regulator for metE and metH
MDLEIRHLRLVDAISREGGMTKAAVRLNLTQSALSHQLREIEERLGTPIFLRLRKKMMLTQAGEKILSASRIVLDELERTESSIRRMATGQEGILRISTQCYTCYHWLPSVLKIFRKLHPKVDVEIVVEATLHPVKALLDGKLDMGIVFKPQEEKLLEYRSLFQDEMLVITSPDHPLSRQPFVKAQDLAEESLIVYSNTTNDSPVFQKVLTPASVMPKSVIRVMLTEAIIEMVKAGIGVGVMAKWAIAPYISSGVVRGVRLTKNGLFREWQAAMLPSPSRPAYYNDFIRLLTKQIAPAFQSPVKRFKKAPAPLEIISAAR